MTKLATSPVSADSALATSRMITSGLRNLPRNSTASALLALAVDQVGAVLRQPRGGRRAVQSRRPGVQLAQQFGQRHGPESLGREAEMPATAIASRSSSKDAPVARQEPASQIVRCRCCMRRRSNRSDRSTMRSAKTSAIPVHGVTDCAIASVAVRLPISVDAYQMPSELDCGGCQSAFARLQQQAQLVRFVVAPADAVAQILPHQQDHAGGAVGVDLDARHFAHAALQHRRVAAIGRYAEGVASADRRGARSIARVASWSKPLSIWR